MKIVRVDAEADDGDADALDDAIAIAEQVTLLQRRFVEAAGGGQFARGVRERSLEESPRALVESQELTHTLAEFGIALRRQPGRVLFHNYPMVLQQTLLGRGVALGWRPLIDEYVAGGALEIVGPEVRSSRGYYVTWPTGRPSEPVQALIDWLADRC